MADKTLRERCEMRLSGMKAVRAPYEPDWEEIARLCAPSRPDAVIAKSGGRNPRRANMALYSGKGRKAARTLALGMTSGLSSPSSLWFKLETRDKDMMEFQPVKEWLTEVERKIYNLFASTNFYNAAKIGYNEIGCFGVDSAVLVEHPQMQMVSHVLSAGTYWLANNDAMIADTLYRPVPMTVSQVVEAFVRPGGWGVVTKTVRSAFDRGDYQTIVPVYHAIEPNRERDPTKWDAQNMEFRSIYWEEGQTHKETLLRNSGYEEKPFYAARWIETGGNRVWGDGPGYDALADLRELQLAAKRRGRATDMLLKPPMAAPVGMTNTFLSLDPGTIAYGAANDLGQVKALLEPDYRTLQVLREEVMQFGNDVAECFYADLFMAITDMEGVQPRNERELLMREDEKLTQLGPVVERVNVEKLEVAIDRAFNILDKNGEIPPAPDELQGEPLKVDFISRLTMAQRAATLNSTQRVAQFVGFLSGIYPDAAMKFDADQAIDEFATGAGTSPKIIRSDEIVAKMRDQAAEAQQQERMAAMMPAAEQGAKAAELLSRTQVGDRSMLERVGAMA